MLQAKTEKELSHIEKLLDDWNVLTYGATIEDGVHVDDFVPFEVMAMIVDYLRTSDPQKELFEECWVAYRRKGSKKKAFDYWKKLSDKEKPLVIKHIVPYVTSRELRFQKDFERYLRDKVFLTVVFQGNKIIYDPMVGVSDAYMPATDGAIKWNEANKCYIYIGMFFGYIPDGYTDDNRPNHARIMLNNGGGMLTWNSESKKWNKV